ncbi:MAG: SHOCT domain-containing protein [Anaerolineales bacterium]|nr:SHOCT domain-containing protein [Anaerolineales bacterium]
MGGWHHGFGFGGWEGLLVGGLFMLIFWGGVFAVLYFVIRSAAGWSRSDASGGTAGRDPHAILARRFAEGEIDAEQFKEMKRTLDQTL